MISTRPRRVQAAGPPAGGHHGVVDTRVAALAGLGLALVGAGLSIAIDAGTRRAAGRSWVARGTGGLVAVGSGLSVFGDAVRRTTTQSR